MAYGIVIAPYISKLAQNCGERLEWRGHERQEKERKKERRTAAS